MWRDDACLLDMLIAARKIRAFTDGVTSVRDALDLGARRFGRR
jgi:hypothetical protein